MHHYLDSQDYKNQSKESKYQKNHSLFINLENNQEIFYRINDSKFIQ